MTNFTTHPWHGVSAGENAPEKVNVFVEIVPSDSIKYEIDKEQFYFRCSTFNSYMDRLYPVSDYFRYSM